MTGFLLDILITDLVIQPRQFQLTR